MKKAFKKTYDYISSDKYVFFLKKNITKLTPRFYSVISSRPVDTTSGPMIAVRIVQDEVENPHHEPIAEIWINNEYVFLWRDHCWKVAVNEKGSMICDFWTTDFGITISRDKRYIAPRPCNKTVLLYQIGQEEVT